MAREYLFFLLSLSLTTATGFAQNTERLPAVLDREALPIEWIAQVSLAATDLDSVAQEDAERQEQGLPPRYAIPHAVSIGPDSGGTWEAVPDGRLMWRLRIAAPGAVSLNLGFSEFYLPPGGRLLVYSTDFEDVIGPFTAQDNEDHGQLWTPIIPSDDIVVELIVPEDGISELRLLLAQIGHGYRGFGTNVGPAPESGSCNVDVICPEGDAWRNEIPSVAVISTGGSTFCTGFLVNNTANDTTPYFMTAAHCGIYSSNAASLVVYWNYETSVCGATPDGNLSQFNTGSYWRAAYSPSDFTLVELDDDPDPAFGVSFSGWDATGTDASSAVAIHHPDTDEKRISFEYEPTTTTSYLSNAVPGDGTHVRVTDWDLGTTEPGSSGSPLFNQDHRIIGQLHGGYASCTSQTSDWYGKFSRSWTGGGAPTNRLRDWLDPGNTGLLTVDTIGNALSVTPTGSVLHAGPVGGPFTNPSTTYTLTNNSTTPVDYRVSLTAAFGILLEGGTTPVSGTLAAGGGAAPVVVSLGPDIDSLNVGLYEEHILFDDLTNGVTKTGLHIVEVGRERIRSFTFDSDPGWAVEDQWAFGVPTGAGGQYGGPDPISGHTGSNVYGYNLNGDYANNLPQRHLTSTPIDCTGYQDLQLWFWRWLNVEQPQYDHASLSVSNNGSQFVTLWSNGSEITDSSWSQQSFDISAIADNEPTVYLRWTMGTTDSSWQYSGWNLDDVELWGFTLEDCNGNGIPDALDLAACGKQAWCNDCNNNGILDECDIASGTSANDLRPSAGIPDECEIGTRSGRRSGSIRNGP